MDRHVRRWGWRGPSPGLPDCLLLNAWVFPSRPALPLLPFVLLYSVMLCSFSDGSVQLCSVWFLSILCCVLFCSVALWYVQLYCVLILFCFVPFYSIMLCFILLYSIRVPFYAVIFRLDPSYNVLFYYVIFQGIMLYSILFYSVMFHSVLMFTFHTLYSIGYVIKKCNNNNSIQYVIQF